MWCKKEKKTGGVSIWLGIEGKQIKFAYIAYQITVCCPIRWCVRPLIVLSSETRGCCVCCNLEGSSHCEGAIYGLWFEVSVFVRGLIGWRKVLETCTRKWKGKFCGWWILTGPCIVRGCLVWLLCIVSIIINVWTKRVTRVPKQEAGRGHRQCLITCSEG